MTDATDLSKRLRMFGGHTSMWLIAQEAADYIDRLQAGLSKARDAALEEAAAVADAEYVPLRHEAPQAIITADPVDAALAGVAVAKRSIAARIRALKSKDSANG